MFIMKHGKSERERGKRNAPNIAVTKYGYLPTHAVSGQSWGWEKTMSRL